MKEIDFDEKVLEGLGLNPVWVNGRMLFFAKDLCFLINYLDKMGFLFLGADGVRVEGGNVIPDMDWIIDFFDGDPSNMIVDEFLDNLKLFLDDAPDDVLFECVWAKKKT